MPMPRPLIRASGRGFKPELIQQIVELATEGLTPELTLLFDLSVAASAVRTRRRKAAKRSDRLDQESNQIFMSACAKLIWTSRKHNPHRVRVIDAKGSAQETHELAMDIVDSVFGGKRIPGRQSRWPKSKVPRG